MMNKKPTQHPTDVPPRIYLPASLRQPIEEHLGAAYPQEACGLLLTEPNQPLMQPEREIHIAAVWPMANEAPEAERFNRYAIAPAAMHQAQNQASAAGLDIVGVYHSHPDAPAQPSATDLTAAWPVYIYIIVHTGSTGATEWQAWRLSEDGPHRVFVQVALET
ncbi:MAG: M67 family metallopeptidase [Phycisphaerales bacterium]|nr:M67 family metallopeptidase [Phycisphaerales bacterium]